VRSSKKAWRCVVKEKGQSMQEVRDGGETVSRKACLWAKYKAEDGGALSAMTYTATHTRCVARASAAARTW
jgi:hypothetical protein